MIDWHCHILPGTDDGPATMDESVEMAQALRRAGFTTIHCTPHLIRGYCQAANSEVLHGVRRLQECVDKEGVGIRLLPGREYYLDEFLLDYLKEPLPLGDTKYLLVEVPSHALPAYVKETCYRIRCSGYVPMIAHPERCVLFAAPESEPDGWLKALGSWLKVLDPKHAPRTPKSEGASLLDYLKEIGCAFQGNLGSFAGRYGEAVKRSAIWLKENGIYSHFGTDLHSAARFDQTMAGAAAAGVSCCRHIGQELLASKE